MQQVSGGQVGELEKLSTAQMLSFADFQEQHISKNIQMADAKAGVTIVYSTGALAFMFGNAGFIASIATPAVSVAYITQLIGILALGLASALGFWVVTPRLKADRRGLVFWHDVSEATHSTEPMRRLKSMTQDALVQQRLLHCYDLSKVCQAKFMFLRFAMFSAIVGFVCSLIWLGLQLG